MIHRTWAVLLGMLLVSSAARPLHAQDGAAQQPAGPLLQTIRITGSSVYAQQELASRHRLVLGNSLEAPADDIAAAIRRQYRDDGYTLATVTARFDTATGTLAVDIDEGRFESIDVEGLDEAGRQHVLERLALQPGEVFNQTQADRALENALAVANGAIRRAEPTFAIVSDAGRRVLQIALQARHQESGAFVGTQGREDWYSPVDAFNAAIGAHGTLFDRTRFNHTYWSGYVSYKFGPDRAGYSFGIERAFLPGGALVAGATIQDLTASDDRWRLSDAEQSLVAFTFRNTFRDYYRRKGYQLHAAFKPLPTHELLLAWRDESHATIGNETNYGLFRDRHVFRPNGAADPGDLRAVIVGYTFDSRGVGGESTAERYQRHLVDDLFGNEAGREHGVRFDWRSELAPASLRHDFDFSRHIANLRGWWKPGSGRSVSGRVLAGMAAGTLPQQRALALGGIGSVRGYGFKEQSGDGLLLFNGEFRQPIGRSEFAGLAFLDVGRVYGAATSATDTWMRGVGVGLEFDGGARIEFGWRLDAIPSSLQVLFRLRPSF